MNINKKSLINHSLRCDICKMDLMSNAEYALHEFSKKHCDNLIRIAKHKPVVLKQKVKTETHENQKETPKVNTVTYTGSFAKYGYFVPGQIYTTGEVSKEFNTDYDPYLQKFAENPCKEKNSSSGILHNDQLSSTHCSNISFSRNKKKKIKTCQICNVTLTTVPEYEAHMKSPQHIWKLKATGIGVSAHFVKASTDLHTTDINENSKPKSNAEEEQLVNLNSSNGNTTPNPFPLLYCSDCELLLNSPQQYSAHIVGKSHIENAQKKAEIKAKKEKLLNPTPNVLYCYSCKISLNNLFQYNEHKNGKKHKTKCRQLIKNGITIPPEERVTGLNVPKPYLNKPIVYPELYEKFVLDKQTNSSNTDDEISVTNRESQLSQTENMPGVYCCEFCNEKFETLCMLNHHIKILEHNQICTDSFVKSNVNDSIESNICNKNPPTENDESVNVKKPSIIFYSKVSSTLNEKECSPNCEEKNTNQCISTVSSEICTLNLVNEFQASSSGCVEIAHTVVEKEEQKIENHPDQINVIVEGDLKCNICELNFQWQSQFDLHLVKENHFKKILELKSKKISDTDILKVIFCDRSLVKPDNLGRLSCSFCNVIAENRTEFEQHLKSIVHKYTIKDYRRKKTLEVKSMVAVNLQGLYYCKKCKEGWSSLVEFIQHLHFSRHRSIQSNEKIQKIMAKRRLLNLQKQKVTNRLRKKNYPSWQAKFEKKNPGVRTKVGGVATDLNTGAQASIPNLEPLEPNIDPTKNINLGLQENSVKVKVTRNKKPKFKRQRQHTAAVKRTSHLSVSQQSLYPEEIPPLLPSLHTNFNSMMTAHFQIPPPFPRNPQPNCFMRNRPWFFYPNSYPSVSRPYFGRPMMINTPRGPRCFQKTQCPRFGYC